MLHTLKIQFYILLIVATIVIVTPLAYAGNPLYANIDGTPLIWDTSTTIKYKVDSEGLGKLDYDQSLTLIQKSLEVWEAVSGTGIEFEYLGPTDEDITIQNWEDIAANHIYAEGYGIIPAGTTDSQMNHYLVIGFDNTGEIIEAKGSGSASGVQSLTGVSGTLEDPQYIISGHVFLNGLYFNGTDSDISDLEMIDLMAIVIHELGHALGLDHNLFHYEMYKRILQGSLTKNYSRYLPTMFPRFIKTTGSHMITLHPDDIATLKWMYGADDYYTVSGSVFDSEGSPQNTLLVTARNTTSSLCQAFAQATSSTCGDMNTLSSGDGSNYFNGKYCMDQNSLGYYEIPVLESADYSLDVQEIPDFFESSIAKFGSNINSIAGGAEFYNDDDEASESSYVFDEIRIHGDDLEDVDITLSSSEPITNGLERFDYTYFEDSVYFNIFEDDPDCPEENSYDIESVVYNASLVSPSSSSSASTSNAQGASCGLSINSSQTPQQNNSIFILYAFSIVGLIYVKKRSAKTKILKA